MSETQAKEVNNNVEVNEKPQKPRKKMNRTVKYVLNIIIILAVTGIYSWLTLKDQYKEVVAALQNPNADYRFLAVILVLILVYYLIEGLILFIFARLYTTTYKLHRGVANAFIGQFFCDITPSASGGQFAQAVTFKKQGVEVSNAASILVMHHIIYSVVLLVFNFIAIVANINTFVNAAPVNIFGLSIPVWVFTLLGYLLNVLLIVGIFLLAYSKRFHNWVINKGVNIGAKLKLIRNPEERKKKLRLSTENFRIELRRLQSNVPVTILIAVLFVARFFIIYSVPYFVIVMLDPSYTTQPIYISTVVRNSFLRITTDLFPLPGSAGFAEYFFERLFLPVLGNNLPFVKAVQILWRFFTFYFGLIVGGFVAAFYRSSMEKTLEETEDKTFRDLQSETLEERTISSDTAYATSSLSVVQIKKRLTTRFTKNKKKKNTSKIEDEEDNE